MAGETCGVDVRQVARDLGVEERKILYWRRVLLKHALISPSIVGSNKHEFSEKDVAQFKLLKDFLENGAQTATEAARLMAQSARPEELYAQYKTAQRQIEVLQKKVLQLRKPLWKRLIDWVRGLLSGVLFPRTDQ